MIHITKRTLVAAAGALLLSLALPAAHAAAKFLKVKKSVTIAAEPQAVWDLVKNFDGLHTWHPGFSGDEIIKGANNEPKAVRKLTLKDGPSFTEELLRYDDAAHSMRYRIIESPLPINTYVSTIKVEAGKGKGTSVVTWEGQFKRKKESNPGPGETDAAVTKLVSGVYDAGLGNLKKIAEGK